LGQKKFRCKDHLTGRVKSMDLRYQKGNNRPEGRYQKGNKIPKTVAKDLFFSFLRSVMGTLFNCCFKFSGSTQTLSGMKIGQDNLQRPRPPPTTSEPPATDSPRT